MKVFAIGDPHLAGSRCKTMDVFGESWQDHAARMAADWDARVREEDLVLLPGDISWAMRIEGAAGDLAWLSARPGSKALIRGNHDYWWQSLRKVREALGPDCHAIQNSVHVSEDGRLAVAGSRMWVVPGLALGDIFEQPAEGEGRPAAPRDAEKDDKLFAREMRRLEMSLESIPASAERRIAMTHFAPTNADCEGTLVTDLLERYDVQVCVFGHLHNVRKGVEFSGERNGVRYALVSSDYLDFRLAEIV